jgi:glycosyltransferase involved in cell wall biosynthesis
MRVLRVIPSVDLKNGGPVNGLMATTPLLVEKGIDVEVLTLDHPDSQCVKEFPYKCYSFNDVRFGYGYSNKAKKWLLDNVKNYDAVIIHGLWQFHSHAAATACLKEKVPYYVFTHGMLDPWFNEQSLLKTIKKNIYWKLFEAKVISNANSVLFTSLTEMEVSARSFKPYVARGKVVAYGSPMPDVKLDEAKEGFFVKFPNLKDKKFFLFLSRIHPKKGVDLLIEAAVNAKLVDTDIHIVIAGPGDNEYQQKLLRLVKNSGLESNITWTGMLSGDEKWGAFVAADCFILPSHQENFGIVVSEALSTGTPVLITNKVNIFKEIESFKAGLVGEDSRVGVEGLITQWLDLNDEQKLTMRENSVVCYESNFSIISAVLDLEKILIEKNN